MVSRFNFRAWNSKNKEFNYFGFDYVKGCNLPTNQNYIEKAPIMQSTGHIDKNKKEVFDGDIVFDGAEYSIIEYNQERLRFQEYRKTSIDTINAYTLSHREIVGNIIENRDLAIKIKTLKE